MATSFNPSANVAPFGVRSSLANLKMADEHFDYLVIGGGSGGIASGRRAAAHGAKVAVIERGRLGGTCVNVGCVPKKVMFNAGTVQEMIHQSSGYGFSVENVKFDMAALKAKRDAYVTRLNGIYANNLKNSGITEITGDASFVGPKEVRVGDKTYSGDNVLIAVGGTPEMPEIPGIEHAINSDGFFDLDHIPKRVAVVGSGYIAVELAGILQLLGSQVDLFIRGELPLRSMEPDVVSLLVDEMSAMGVNWVRGEIASLDAATDGTKSATLKSGESHSGYDEVLFAIGRKPVTESLNLGAAGVDTTARGEVIVNAASQTTAAGTYAVGDIITGAVQLTPVAIAAGRLLSDRLYGGVPESETIMDYDNVPTVVFSHPTMAVMGLTEAQAIERYGADAVTCHKSTWVNMLYSREFLVDGGNGTPENPKPPFTRAKIVCVGEEQRVVGLHMIGLAVDEILQGFGVAIKMGATKADFDSIVALHPTSAEELVTIPPWQAKYKAH
jgi:glutathione reductase (NADPH)